MLTDVFLVRGVHRPAKLIQVLHQRFQQALQLLLTQARELLRSIVEHLAGEPLERLCQALFRLLEAGLLAFEVDGLFLQPGPRDRKRLLALGEFRAQRVPLAPPAPGRTLHRKPAKQRTEQQPAHPSEQQAIEVQLGQPVSHRPPPPRAFA